MGVRFLHRLALPLASWCALPYILCDHSYTNHLIGSLLVSRHHVQYPAALGGPFVSTSTNTYRRSSMIPSIGVLIGDLVLDSWSNHVFHFRWVVPLSAPPYPPSLVTGSSIAEIVSAFPTCGGLCVSLRHILAPVRLIRSSDRYTASAQLVPKKHRPIVSTFLDRPSRARTHDTGGRLGCGLAQHSWPSGGSVFYRIWSLKHDLGCHCRRQRWQLPSHLWQGRRSLRRVIDIPRYPGTFGECPLDGILSSMTGFSNAVPASHRTVLRPVISQRLQKDSFSSILALPLVRDNHHTTSPFSVLRSSTQ